MQETTFSIDRNVLTVTRTFDANIDLVWRGWTEAALLDQWWAPKPWQSKTKRMEFQEGGQRLYSMCGPEGQEHWGLTTYEAISHHDNFAGNDAFCDREGKVNPDFPVAYFRNQFSEDSGKTNVTVVTEYASEAHLQQVIEMGMKEGLRMAYDNLDQVLQSL